MADHKQLEQTLKDFFKKECKSLPLVEFKAMVKAHMACISFVVEHDGKKIPSCDLVDLKLMKDNKLEFIEDQVTEIIKADPSFEQDKLNIIEFTCA